MPPLHLLIKPVSASCNMKCSYCFYNDIAENRAKPIYGVMSDDIIEIIVRKAISFADKECTFAFQGGEPTLAPLSFFENVVKLQQAYNDKKLVIRNIIQTNALNISEEYIAFFAKHRFLVGVSLDGTKSTHDSLRKDIAGKETYSRVISTISALNQYNVEYNILTVITSWTAKKIQSIYQDYKKQGFDYLQFIPCIDPLDNHQSPYALNAVAYSQFLKTLFDLWYRDYKDGKLVHIRQFENYVEMLLGYPPESCGVSGHCSMQNVIEADGSVYPCDFYVLDEYYLGNIKDCEFSELRTLSSNFLDGGEDISPDCLNCDVYSLCRGGCRRYRKDGKNILCTAYYEFFHYALPRLKQIATNLRQNNL